MSASNTRHSACAIDKSVFSCILCTDISGDFQDFLKIKPLIFIFFWRHHDHASDFLDLSGFFDPSDDRLHDSVPQPKRWFPSQRSRTELLSRRRRRRFHWQPARRLPAKTHPTRTLPSRWHLGRSRLCHWLSSWKCLGRSRLQNHPTGWLSATRAKDVPESANPPPRWRVAR